MLDDRDSITNQKDDTNVNQEISLWLRERFEERTHPFTSQRLPQLVHSGSRLARWVVNHPGLTAMISRAKKLTSLPRSLGILISRKPAAGIPGQYQSMNLPWFKPKKDDRQGPTKKIVFKSQGEVASDIEGSFDNKILQLSHESSGEKQEIIDEKMPETYIKHLISPPLARKPAIDFVDNILSPASTKNSHITAIKYSDDSDKVVERSPSPGTIIQPTPLVSSQIISQLNRLTSNTSSGQSSQYTHRAFPPIISAQKNLSDIERSSIEHISQQNTTGTKTLSTRIEVKQKRPDNVNVPPILFEAEKRAPYEIAPNKANNTNIPDVIKTSTVDFTSVKGFEEGWQESHTAETPTMGKLVTTVKDDTEKDTNNSDLAKESLYGKPLSVGQRIVQLLPFIKNISRKISRSAEPITVEKQTELHINRLPTNSLEIIPPHDETQEVTSGNAVISNIHDVNKTSTVDFTSVKGFEEGWQESHTAETPTMGKLVATVKEGTGKDAGHAYPVKDLSYRKSPHFGQRIVQSLPLMRNISKKVDLSSEAPLSIYRKQYTLNDIPLPLANLEMLQVHGTSDGIRKSKTDSRLIPQIISDRTPHITSNTISVSRTPEAIYNGTRAADNKFDLVLKPVNRLLATQQEENYYQFDESTQYIQRMQGSAANQSMQQTQTDQVSQPNATQASELKLPDKNINMNEYQPDIRALAREIYPLIRRMIVVERERRPSR